MVVNSSWTGVNDPSACPGLDIKITLGGGGMKKGMKRTCIFGRFYQALIIIKSKWFISVLSFIRFPLQTRFTRIMNINTM